MIDRPGNWRFSSPETSASGRKTALLVAATSVSLALLSSAGLAQEQLVVAGSGGRTGEAWDQCIIKPFTEATGIKVIYDPGVSSVTLAKLLQSKGNPTLDLAWFDGEASGFAREQGVFADMDPAKLPNLDNLIDHAISKDPDGTIWGIGTGYYSVGIIYNTDEVKEPPTSWLDLWKPEFAGRVTMPSIQDGSGAPWLVYLASLLGGGVDNLDPAIKKMQELEVAAYYDSGGAAASLLSSGEAVIGILDSGTVWSLADSGAIPVGFAIPKEGALASDNRLHMMKPSDAAYAFLNTAMTPEAAECIGDFLYLGPAVKDVELSEEAKARLPWGANGSIDNLIFSDTKAIDKIRPQLVELWNREIIGQ
jgi:putative spermidine/putrescine transport system substrate-binding protein